MLLGSQAGERQKNTCVKSGSLKCADMVIVLLLCIIYLIVCISIRILLRKIIFPEEFVYNVCRIFWTDISVGTCIFSQLKLEDIKSVCTLWPLGLRLRCGMVACVVNCLY